MEELSKTDKLFTGLSIALILISVIAFLILPDQGKPMFIYLFVGVSLMITTILAFVMAGFTYSEGQDKSEIEFTGKDGLLKQFTKTTEQDKTILLASIAVLAFVLIIINLVRF